MSVMSRNNGGAGSVIERLLQDERVHEQVAAAAANLRAAGERVNRRGAAAAADEGLYTQVGKAAASLRAAVARALGQPEPEPERVGGFGSLVVLGAGIALLVTGWRSAD